MPTTDPPAASSRRSGAVSAAEAARILQVKPQTLYAYVSRGLLRSVAAARGRARRYMLEDVRRLKARSDARRGHVAVAAAALDWGAPVLDSAITRIDEHGPHYRGRSAIELARAGVSFESVCEWLWASGNDAASRSAGAVPPADAAPAANLPASLQVALERTAEVIPRGTAPIRVLSALTPIAGLCDGEPRALALEQEWARARALLRAMAAALQLGRRAHAATLRRGERVAELACRALGAEKTPARVQAIDHMLVLSADHELNVSAFAVRVTASSGADLYACLCTGLSAMGGPLHGGMCDRIEALLAACAKPADARELVRERARLGAYVPGFGHPLYPAGDPRGQLLLQRAYELAPRASELKVARALADQMQDSRQPAPTLDFGLVALRIALGLVPGAASALFALGRTAGWVAHTLEQRTQKHLVRPRARYVGEDAGMGMGTREGGKTGSPG